jgi:hypothetical protein
MRYVPGLTSKEGGFERTGLAHADAMGRSAASADFSTNQNATLYLPVDPLTRSTHRCGAARDRDSLWHLVERLIYLRVTEFRSRAGRIARAAECLLARLSARLSTRLHR